MTPEPIEWFYLAKVGGVAVVWILLAWLVLAQLVPTRVEIEDAAPRLNVEHERRIYDAVTAPGRHGEAREPRVGRTRGEIRPFINPSNRTAVRREHLQALTKAGDRSVS